MRTLRPYLVIITLMLAGCGWWGDEEAEEAETTPPEEVNPLIPQRTNILGENPRTSGVYAGTTVDRISDLTVERVPGGLLIRATGQSATLGIYNARLTPTNADEQPEDGVLTYQLQAEYVPAVGGSPQAREVTVARTRTDQELGDTRIIRVQAQQNTLQKRR